MKKLVTLVLTLGLVSVSTAADEIPLKSRDTITPLVELYTSEGCSSCPRADKWLSKLGDHLDAGEIGPLHALPLAFHVTYWNYLGWRDPFSQEQFTQRQRELAGLNKQTSIYTPEFMVAGKEARSGTAVIDMIQTANMSPAEVDIDGSVKLVADNQLDLVLTSDNRFDGQVMAHVAIFENGLVREIKGGENSGRTLTYDFVVRYWSGEFPLDSGTDENRLKIALEDDWNRDGIGVAIVASDIASGEVLQTVSSSLMPLFGQAAGG